MYCIDKIGTTEENSHKTRIAIYGSRKDINFANLCINFTDLLQKEPEDRLIIQKLIDTKKIKAIILYDGNTVWSFNTVIRDFKRYMKGGQMTNYLYKFLSLTCGSIAHYDKFGWSSTYPPSEMRAFFQRNEFGERVYDHIPVWKTDAKKIVKEIERILEIK
jgi:hypothetical protein